MQAADGFRSAGEKARIAAEAEAEARLSAEERARRGREERALWEQLADEAEQPSCHSRCNSKRCTPQPRPHHRRQRPPSLLRLKMRRRQSISMRHRRALIHAHLRARSRKVDAPTLRYSSGASSGQGTAIWRSRNGRQKAARRTTHFSSRCAASPGAGEFGPLRKALQGLLEIDAEAGTGRAAESARSPARLHSPKPFANLYRACPNVGTNRPPTSCHQLIALASGSSLLKSDTQALIPGVRFSRYGSGRSSRVHSITQKCGFFGPPQPQYPCRGRLKVGSSDDDHFGKTLK